MFYPLIKPLTVPSALITELGFLPGREKHHRQMGTKKKERKKKKKNNLTFPQRKDREEII